MLELIETKFLGNHLRTWGVALLAALLTLVILRLLKGFAIKRLRRLSEQTDTQWDDLLVDVLDSTKIFFLLLISAYVGAHFLRLPDKVQSIFSKSMGLIALLQFAFWGSAVIRFWIERHMKRRAAEDVAIATTMGLVSLAARMLLYAMVLLLALNNVGVDITALVAGLGVGGIAIALAVQNILGDLFASLTIVLDKPFVVGDPIQVGEFSGSIEHIGLKTTRLRSSNGEQLIFSNTDLLQSRIRNYKRMNERRVQLNLGVTYSTTQAQLEKIPGMLRAIIEARPKTRFERAHLFAFADSSINYEIVFWMTDTDYQLYMDVRQTIHLEIMRQFTAAGIEFAFPTRTIQVQQVPAGIPAGALPVA